MSTQKNFGMDLNLRKSPTRTFVLAQAAHDAYHVPAEPRYQEEDAEYDPSCNDFCLYGINGYMIARNFTQFLLPHDHITPVLVGFGACATALCAANKLTQERAKEKKD